MREPTFTQLTAQQADGTACVVCGRTFVTDADRPTDSVGIAAATGSQVFACDRMCTDIATVRGVSA